MAVATCAQKGLRKIIYNNLEKTHTKTNKLQLLTLHDFMSAQGTGAYCVNIWLTVGIPGLYFNLDKSRILVRDLSIDCAVQKVVSQ